MNDLDQNSLHVQNNLSQQQDIIEENIIRQDDVQQDIIRHDDIRHESTIINLYVIPIPPSAPPPSDRRQMPHRHLRPRRRW